MAWEYAHIGFEDDRFCLEGTEVWQAEWKRLDGQRVDLPHPSYNHQIHPFDLYEIQTEKGLVRFALSELSNGVYGFYRWRPE